MDQSKKPLIMVVDDNPVNIDVLDKLLINAGYETLGVTHGAEAFDTAADKKPDLILLDIMMPDIDGYAVCAALKRSAATNEIPVIFITALGDRESMLRGFEAGGVDYVGKPFNPQELLARVDVQIELKKARDERDQLIKELRAAIDEVKTLRGLLPVCAHCKKIRDDNGYWQQMEQYISAHSDTQFTHTFCPECLQKLYPDDD